MEFAVGRLQYVFAELLGAPIKRVERLGPAHGHAPMDLRRRLGDGRGSNCRCACPDACSACRLQQPATVDACHDCRPPRRLWREMLEGMLGPRAARGARQMPDVSLPNAIAVHGGSRFSAWTASVHVALL